MHNQYLALPNTEPEFARNAFERLFFDRFAGRLETYAVKLEMADRAMYLPSTYSGESEFAQQAVRRIVADIGTDEFTEEVVRAHLDGRHLIGVYPITKDSTVSFFALDFDRKTEDDPDPWDVAVAQATVFTTEAGLHVYIERSQGGKGYHVWGFLDGAVNAGKVRHALSPFIETVESYDRMFPNQQGVSETRPLGNLIALPLAGTKVVDGNSCFVQRGPAGRPVPVADQIAFLRNVKLNSVDKIEELFALAGQYQPETQARARTEGIEGLAKGWKMTHPVYGCEWVQWCYAHPHLVNEPMWYALACQFAQFGEDGRNAFHLWSEQDGQRYSARHTDKKFDQALKQNKPHTCAAIRDLGGTCTCDARFPGDVRHPYDLAKISFLRLVHSMSSEEAETQIVGPAEGFAKAFQWIEDVENDPTIGRGRPYGIPEIDAATGMRDGDLIIIGGRPGMGKTAFSNTVVDNTAVQQIPNYYFSIEMSAEQFYKRLISTHTGVSQTRMMLGQTTPRDKAKFADAKALLFDQARYPVYVDGTSRSSERIFEIAADLVHRHGKGIIWVDYLQLMQRNPRETMFDAVSRCVHDLGLLAKALQVPVVALTQLNRTADDATSDSQTFDGMLRGSGDIEQVASVILFILGEKGPGVKERLIALHKERHREGGLRFTVEFNQPLMRFASAHTWGLTMQEPQITRRPSAPRTGGTGDMSSVEMLSPDAVRQMMAASQASAELPPGTALSDEEWAAYQRTGTLPATASAPVVPAMLLFPQEIEQIFAPAAHPQLGAVSEDTEHAERMDSFMVGLSD